MRLFTHKNWMPFAYCSVIIWNKRQNCSLNQVIKSNGKCSFWRLGRIFMAFKIDNRDNENVRMHKWKFTICECLCMRVSVCVVLLYLTAKFIKQNDKVVSSFPFLWHSNSSNNNNNSNDDEVCSVDFKNGVSTYIFSLKKTFRFYELSTRIVSHQSHACVCVCLCPFIQNDIFKIDVPMYSWEYSTLCA